MSEVAAEWVSITDLKPWEQNPRNNDHAVADVASSIERFGFASPIIARMNGEVIAGHTRLKAAQSLGLDRVPVRYMDLDPADAKMLALADNKIGELADWNQESLAEILQGLADDDLDLDGLGWTGDELSALLDAPMGLEDAQEHDTDDHIPEDVEPLTSPGEVIALGKHTLHCGDCLEVMAAMPDSSVDAVVTDPPYGIGFMGKGWDCSVPGDAFAQQAYRVLKPGGHLIAFAATRTIHRLTTALEDAGFEVRDQIGWLQWQGFPKSLDVSKSIDAAAGVEREVVGFKQAGIGTGESYGKIVGDRLPVASTDVPITAPTTDDAKRWQGFGTGLKPAFEPCILVRKPLAGTVAETVMEHGTGALNIDGCRFAYGDPAWPGPGDQLDSRQVQESQARGVALSGSVDGSLRKAWFFDGSAGRFPANIYHCPKPSRSEREDGCEDMPSRQPPAVEHAGRGAKGLSSPRAGAGRTAEHVKNNHPTVKPVALMRWLVRLVGCQPGSVVLEPFCGSGTTLVAADREGFKCIAIEMDPGYCDIIRARFTA